MFGRTSEITFGGESGKTNMEIRRPPWLVCESNIFYLPPNYSAEENPATNRRISTLYRITEIRELGNRPLLD